MDKSDLFRHAINISDFMRAVSDYFNQGKWPDEQQMRGRKYQSSQKQQTAEEFFRSFDEFGDPIDLDDIGLDDMSLSRVVIELSQTREHFKIWAPFSEDFRIEIKKKIPPHARRWDPDERCWRVDCYWFGNAQELLPKHFPDLERHYTERAIRMCERLARDDEEEVRSTKKKNRRKSSKKGSSKKTRGRSAKTKQKKKTTAPPHEDDYDEYDWKPSPVPKDDPYEILGVSRNAPDEVIKAAHKALARKYHTDATGKASDTDMKRVNAAFEKIKELRKWNTNQP